MLSTEWHDRTNFLSLVDTFFQNLSLPFIGWHSCQLSVSIPALPPAQASTLDMLSSYMDRTIVRHKFSLTIKSVYLFSRIIVSHFPGFHQPESVCQHRVNIAINELHLWSLITSLTPLRAIIHGDRNCPDCTGLVCVRDGPAAGAGDCVFNWHLTAGMLRRWRPGITKQWIYAHALLEVTNI